MGGTFVMNNGKVKQHIMPDFSDIPLNSEAQLNEWLHFYDMKTPLIAVGTFVSAETVRNPRISYMQKQNKRLKLGTHPRQIDL